MEIRLDGRTRYRCPWHLLYLYGRNGRKGHFWWGYSRRLEFSVVGFFNRWFTVFCLMVPVMRAHLSSYVLVQKTRLDIEIPLALGIFIESIDSIIKNVNSSMCM